ncbi:MAG: hypothetical protein ABEH86_07605 [Haloarcula sp.]
MHLFDRLDASLESHSYEAIWIARQRNFAWLTDGGDTIITVRTHSVSAAGYDSDGMRT